MKTKKICKLCAAAILAAIYTTACEALPPQEEAPLTAEVPIAELDEVPEPEEPEPDEAEEERTSEETPEPEAPREPELIGEFSTPIVDDTPSRLKNLELACAYMNGTVVDPGGEFSFNAAVGVRTADRGFEKGYVFVGNEKREQVGGGICQISSTLYNSAMGAGMEITERHPHMREVDYVKAGRDATVAYGELDFKFRNVRDRAVKVEAYVSGGEAVALIWLI